jgi:hypothetical protein
MKQKRILVIALVLSTAAGVLTLQNVFAPAPDLIITSLPAAEESITKAFVPESCAYVWAYHDATELTKDLNAAVQDINPEASARTQFFGEDCIYADGHSTFGAMETDFYVHSPADNLTNEVAFGNWMTQVMSIIVQIPREEIKGNHGFVEFWFEKNETEHIIVHVPIQKYMDESQEKTGVQLFRMFSPAP